MFTFASWVFIFFHLTNWDGSQGFIMKDIHPYRRFESVWADLPLWILFLGIRYLPDPPSELALLAEICRKEKTAAQSAPNLAYKDYRGIQPSDGATLWVNCRCTMYIVEVWLLIWIKLCGNYFALFWRLNLSQLHLTSPCLNFLTNLTPTAPARRKLKHKNFITTTCLSLFKPKRSHLSMTLTQWSPTCKATTGRWRWSLQVC